MSVSLTLSGLFKEPKAHRVLITGGSRGLGNAFAGLFRQSGIEVLTPPRTALDLSSPQSVQKYIEENRASGIDILINNAGINTLNPVDKIRFEDWQTMIQVNLTSAFQLVQGFSEGMKAKGWGRIINIGSIFGVVSREKRAAYSATKAGLNGFTRTAAIELGPYGILVNSVCPGYVDTELTRKNNSEAEIAAIERSIPLRRMAQADELAQMIVMLSSDCNSYMTGQTILVDGGYTCL